eukprot:scaffold830_cov29-Prasinocladus_malaysianus.AAC.1
MRTATLHFSYTLHVAQQRRARRWLLGALQLVPPLLEVGDPSFEESGAKARRQPHREIQHRVGCQERLGAA